MHAGSIDQPPLDLTSDTDRNGGMLSRERPSEPRYIVVYVGTKTGNQEFDRTRVKPGETARNSLCD